MNLSVKVVQDNKDPNQIIVSGGRSDNPTLQEYISELTDEWKIKIKLLAEFIKDSEYYKMKADQFCNENHFRFSDGREIAFTWRGWGDFMQAIVGEREGYMTYYTTSYLD